MLKIGVKSTAILFGDADKTILIVLQVMMFIGLLLLGQKLKLNWLYYGFLIPAAAFAVYQQYLIRNREPIKCFQAFLNNNWLGVMVFFGILTSYVYDNVQAAA